MHSIKSFLHTITGKFVIVVVLLMLSAALALVLASAGLQRSWNSQQIAQAEDDVSLLSTTADNMLKLFEDTLLNLSYNNSVFDDFRFQTDSDSLDYWQNIVKMDNRTQKVQIETSAFSSDIQQVDLILSINYFFKFFG